jgi:serine/threonine-protein kinase HSL1, negative regulator of Swe1 kinase
MEYVEGGELFEYISQQRRLEEREAVYLFRQIIAALLYCDRLSIHHRDLKPENILLDPKTYELKIVDFGMAALQPRGNFLTTPCGSPHYAAPEVIQVKPYDGTKADIWSCGVILYLMLTGTPPFNYPPDPHDKLNDDRKLRGLFQTICRADYKMPGCMSKEARDLIQRIFVISPENRLNIDQVWNHPLMHKYDRDFGFTAEARKIENWIGPGPRIEHWEKLSVRRIDREIFRNLRTLWHSVKEDVIVQKLLSPE